MPRMLCERCQEREVTVYVTLVLGASAETCSHHFCEPCHALVEAEGIKKYNPQPSPSLPRAAVEKISVSQYIHVLERAACDEQAIAIFRSIQEQLQRLAETRQRLALEMLPLAWEVLERGEEPLWMAGFAGLCWNVIEPNRLAEYTGWLEKLVLRLVELRNCLPPPVGEHGPFSMTLFSLLFALGKADRSRFAALLEALKNRSREPSSDARWKVVARAEEAILTEEQRRPRGRRKKPV